MINIARLLRSYRKRRTIKAYLTRIGPMLAKRYGKSERYTPKQVEAAAWEAGLPMADLCCALSVYCNQDALDAYHTALGEDCNYWQMRAEVAEHCFHGNVAFTPHDVAEVAAPHSPTGETISTVMISADIPAIITEGSKSHRRHHPCCSSCRSGRKTRRRSFPL